MSKIFAYKHKGDKGCSKVAFFLVNKPVLGTSLKSDGIILNNGMVPVSLNAIRCGHCNGEIELDTKNVRPARENEVNELLLKSIIHAKKLYDEALAMRDNLAMADELLSKVHPKDTADMYNGSALEASIKYLIGESKQGFMLSDFKETAANN